MEIDKVRQSLCGGGLDVCYQMTIHTQTQCDDEKRFMTDDWRGHYFAEKSSASQRISYNHVLTYESHSAVEVLGGKQRVDAMI